jgi:hypothetical protein
MILKNTENRENSNYPELGYQTVLNLYIYEGNLTWNRYNVMLVANSIMIAGIFLLLSNISSFKLLSIFLSIAGFILCVFWYKLTSQGFWNCKHYYWSAIDIENRYLKHPSNIFSNTAKRPKENLKYLILDKEEELKKEIFQNKLSVKVCALGSISIFFTIYIAIFIKLLFT